MTEWLGGGLQIRLRGFESLTGLMDPMLNENYDNCENCNGVGYFVYPPVCPGGVEEEEMCIFCMGSGRILPTYSSDDDNN